ncbi:MAG: DNA repair protein RadC [Maricaulaceae bacterium]
MADSDLSRPHHVGHRDRLRLRFRDGGQNALADYELLELYLFRSIPRRDVKPLAKALIDRFGGFAETLGARLEQLCEVEGVNERIALDLKILHAGAERLARDRVLGRPVLSSWSALVDYCRVALADQSNEQFRVLFLDRKNRLLADEILGEGTIDHAPVYPREVAKRALAREASALILVHNHPSGDPTPSAADRSMTQEIIQAVGPLGVVVHDHLVIGKERTASFKSLGLL